MLSLELKAGFLFKSNSETLPNANKHFIPRGGGQQEGKGTDKPVQDFKIIFISSKQLNRVCAAKQALKAAFEL